MNNTLKYKKLEIGNIIAKVPIIQGGMGVGVSLSSLAGAVAKEGGVGIISTAQIGFMEKDFENNVFEANLRAMEKEYKKAREIAPDGVIGFNIMVALTHYEDYVKKAGELGADIIISGAGLPVDLPKYAVNSEIKLAPIVSGRRALELILKTWKRRYNKCADMVVIEGPDAGGHLGFHKDEVISSTREKFAITVKDILEGVQKFADDFGRKIPVVLAGGIDDAKAVDGAFKLGVDGVQVATRFVTTEECDASDEYKQQYINAKKEDVVLVTSPVGMPGRAIRNKFIERIESGEKIRPAKCLHCLKKCDIAEIPYCITEALVNAAKGKTDDALVFCGKYSYKCNKIQTVKEVMTELMYEPS